MSERTELNALLRELVYQLGLRNQIEAIRMGMEAVSRGGSEAQTSELVNRLVEESKPLNSDGGLRTRTGSGNTSGST